MVPTYVGTQTGGGMKAIVLAAGYATRLYPLTQNKPKPLLPVGDVPILDHILERVREIDEVDDVVVVTNDKFYSQFCDWAKGRQDSCRVLNDGTRENDRRLGAIGDIQFVISEGNISEDVLILAGDNLFDFSLKNFVNAFHENGTSVACFELEKRQDASRFGVIELDGKGRIKHFWEKPQKPLTSLISMGIYAYTREDLKAMSRYLQEGGNPDAPGHFLEWLSLRQDVHGVVTQGLWLDIGDLESYEKANLIYQKR